MALFVSPPLSLQYVDVLLSLGSSPHLPGRQ
eukprot:CAMPEP_0174335872 /NCGR_PEP_ID=MMETSP0810-20121108/21140_1 /TAXON_ID=73025 ORGANISM="Eutreptiella gymnastica-like, Strain CCMP1594" /NCGR_SAMPLE_ID=MMETSP0810 /ASSEMBLY_ACC=CAM_ASM_000659 /LENGTH=30 /DNA_ID= /DNA_START= /DNA_END= /DNA_ORIENTATION=